MSLLAQPAPTLEVSCKHPDPPPPFRLYALDYMPQYQIQAFPACRPQNSVVYISTGSQAIVNYTLGPDWMQQLGGRNEMSYNGTNDKWSEQDEENLSTRIIQAGGAVLDTTYPRHDLEYVQRTQQFAAFSRTKKYIFGWPEDGGLWALHLNGLVEWEYWQPEPVSYDTDDGIDAALFEAMDKETEMGYAPLPDGAFYSKKLDQADSMAQYCEELSRFNATFYQDPTASWEALEAGLFDKTTLTVHWPGFASWRTESRERVTGLIKSPSDNESSDEPPKGACMVA